MSYPLIHQNCSLLNYLRGNFHPSPSDKYLWKTLNLCYIRGVIFSTHRTSPTLSWSNLLTISGNASCLECFRFLSRRFGRLRSSYDQIRSIGRSNGDDGQIFESDWESVIDFTVLGIFEGCIIFSCSNHHKTAKIDLPVLIQHCPVLQLHFTGNVNDWAKELELLFQWSMKS